MKDGFDLGLIEGSSILKRGYAGIISNVGKSIAIITVIVATLVTFTDIGFSDVGTAEFTGTLVLMLIASYLMYFSMENAGERLGRESEEYLAAYRDYTAARERLGANNIYGLRRFCKEYAQRELDYRREMRLMAHGYSIREYLEYKESGSCPRGAQSIFRRVRKMKPAYLTPALLLSGCKRGGGGELSNPERAKFPLMLLKMIPTTLCTFFTVSIVLATKENLDAAALIEGILKLCSLPVIGLRGYSCGYLYAKDTLSAWLQTKTKLLNYFTENGCADNKE